MSISSEVPRRACGGRPGPSKEPMLPRSRRSKMSKNPCSSHGPCPIVKATPVAPLAKLARLTVSVASPSPLNGCAVGSRSRRIATAANSRIKQRFNRFGRGLKGWAPGNLFAQAGQKRWPSPPVFALLDILMAFWTAIRGSAPQRVVVKVWCSIRRYWPVRTPH